MPIETPACLVLDDVSREFGGLRAVDGVTMTIRAGERHALIGPNGAGKTTLFNVISGELLPTRGRIALFGDDITRLPPHRRAARGIARTFQISRPFPNLTVVENVLLACQALDRRKLTMHRPLSAYRDFRAHAEELLRRFGLSGLAAVLACNLSYGDQRKLEVALSVAGRPRLLLLDEPMAGLPSGERAGVQHLLDTLDPAMTVLLIEHDIDVALGFAHRVTVLHHGRILAHGSSTDVSANPRVQEIYLGGC